MELPLYFDHASTTPVHPDVLRAMLPYFDTVYGNPSSIHALGHQARDGVEAAREEVAASLGASPEEIYFTSGGTESDTLAVTGTAPGRGRHVISTGIEHSAVLSALGTLRDRGFDVALLEPDSECLIHPDQVSAAIRPDTALASVMHANNETGVVQPICEIGSICRAAGVLFHTDAVQTYGRIPIDVHAMNIDLLSLSAHKIYGPKGVGALYIRHGVHVAPLQAGGEQERGVRGGTLNVPGIVGLGAAVAIARRDMQAESARQSVLRDHLIALLSRALPEASLTGSRAHRLPNNVHICIEGIDGEPLLLALDSAGICVSAGSACSAGSVEPSHVLTAMGIPRDRARGALRITLGRSTSGEGIDYLAEVLCCSVHDLAALAGPSR